MAGGTKRALWLLHVTQAGRMRRREAECGTAPAPREAARLGDKEAMGAGDRAMLGRSPATRCVTNVPICLSVSRMIDRVLLSVCFISLAIKAKKQNMLNIQWGK